MRHPNLTSLKRPYGFFQITLRFRCSKQPEDLKRRDHVEYLKVDVRKYAYFEKIHFCAGSLTVSKKRNQTLELKRNSSNVII
jgi:hypothetical protein